MTTIHAPRPTAVRYPHRDSTIRADRYDEVDWDDESPVTEVGSEPSPRSRGKKAGMAAAFSGSVLGMAALGWILFGQPAHLEVGPGSNPPVPQVSTPAVNLPPAPAAVVPAPQQPAPAPAAVVPAPAAQPAPAPAAPAPAPAPAAPVPAPAPAAQPAPAPVPDNTPRAPIVSVGPDGVAVNPGDGSSVNVGGNGVGVTGADGTSVNVSGNGVQVGVPGVLDLNIPNLLPFP